MQEKNKECKRKKMKGASMGVILLVALTFSLFTVTAQESVSTSGGNASGSGGSVSYSIGQTVYTTNNGINGSVAQGVQQPYEISVVSGTEEAKGISLIASAYPNPTTAFVKLEILNYDVENLTYHLFDIRGKLLEFKKIEGSQTVIDLSQLIAAIYYVKITDQNKEIKVFKIVKN